MKYYKWTTYKDNNSYIGYEFVNSNMSLMFAKYYYDIHMEKYVSVYYGKRLFCNDEMKIIEPISDVEVFCEVV